MSNKNTADLAQATWANVVVNGKEIQAGEKVVLLNEQENQIKVQATSDEVKELRLGLADSGGQRFTANPPFDERVVLVEGACTWKVTPTGSDNTPAILVVYTPDMAEPLTLLCEVSDVNLRFIDLIDRYLPYPPTVVPAHINVIYASGVMMTSKGLPLEGVPVTFHVPEHDTQQVETGPKGKAAMAPIVYKTTGVRTIRAVATLPDRELSVEVLVDVRSST